VGRYFYQGPAFGGDLVFGESPSEAKFHVSVGPELARNRKVKAGTSHKVNINDLAERSSGRVIRWWMFRRRQGGDPIREFDLSVFAGELKVAALSTSSSD
jgi:hypothetical protein